MIRIEKITKRYPMGDYDVEALVDVSFSLFPTGFISIIGPSGCGKTTLLNILGGLDRPTSGAFFHDDVDTLNFSDHDWNVYRHQHVGFIFQHYHLISHLSILDNVMLPLKLMGMSSQEQHEKAYAVLKSLGLRDKAKHKPNQLSGGQQQRAAIARALICEPTIILADEPTGSLDQASSLEIMHILKEISKTRLVVLVTHNEKLAHMFSDRILTLSDGRLVNDDILNPLDSNIKTQKEPHLHKGMSFFTAFMLSASNLKKRLYRTLLILLAASIGIMGMALVLGVSSGFDRYIELRKEETLNAFPIQISKIGIVVPFIDEKYQPNLPQFSNDTIAYPSNIQYEFQTINTLTAEYYTHVLNMHSRLYQDIYYGFGIPAHTIVKNDDVIYDVTSSIQELAVKNAYLQKNFDLLAGSFPDDNQAHGVIVVDRYHRISKDIAQYLGFSGDDPISFASLLNIELKWLPNNILYQTNGFLYSKKQSTTLFNDPQATSITVTGIIRVKEKFELELMRTGLHYNQFTANMIKEDAQHSHIVAAQLRSQSSVIDGSLLSHLQRENLLRTLGYSLYPIQYVIFSSSFSDKDTIMRYLRSYNDTVPTNSAIEPLDIAGIGLSTMRVAIDSTTILLLVFSAISLCISNLMIGIMTYTSVIERIKEIGIIRAIGGKTKDIGHIFYAETMIIGFSSGFIGILLCYLLLPLLNILLEQFTTISNLAHLPLFYAFGLMILNTLLTSISGIIPAHIASKKDPILCLRNE